MTKQKKLVNKRLIKFLMDVRRVEMISITSNTIIVQVSPKFTPEMGNQLLTEVGHQDTARPAVKDGSNYIIFPRY